MRYQEAYELIQVSLDNTLEVPFPVSEKLKAQLFDNLVNDIALRVVRKSIKKNLLQVVIILYLLMQIIVNKYIK